MSVELYREVKRDARKLFIRGLYVAGGVFIGYLLVIAAYFLGIWH